jgi:hypothetical protein
MAATVASPSVGHFCRSGLIQDFKFPRLLLGLQQFKVPRWQSFSNSCSDALGTHRGEHAKGKAERKKRGYSDFRI